MDDLNNQEDIADTVVNLNRKQEARLKSLDSSLRELRGNMKLKREKETNWFKKLFKSSKSNVYSLDKGNSDNSSKSSNISSLIKDSGLPKGVSNFIYELHPVLGMAYDGIYKTISLLKKVKSGKSGGGNTGSRDAFGSQGKLSKGINDFIYELHPVLGMISDSARGIINSAKYVKNKLGKKSSAEKLKESYEDLDKDKKDKKQHKTILGKLDEIIENLKNSKGGDDSESSGGILNKVKETLSDGLKAIGGTLAGLFGIKTAKNLITPNAKTKSKPNTKAKSNAKGKSKSNTKAKTKPEAKPKTKATAKPKTKPKVPSIKKTPKPGFFSKALNKIKNFAKPAGKVAGKLALPATIALEAGSDIYEIASSDKNSEVAAKELLNRKKENGFESWWDYINPYAYGQQAALELGVDEKVEGFVDKIFDTFFKADPAEKMKKYEKEAKERLGKREIPITLEVVSKDSTKITTDNEVNTEKEISTNKTIKQNQDMMETINSNKSSEESNTTNNNISSSASVNNEFLPTSPTIMTILHPGNSK